MEALRDIVYFPGANPTRWIMQVLFWTIGLLVVTLFIEGARLIWRLQSVVIRTQRHANSLSEHLQLMSVPQQPKLDRGALTAGTPAAATSAPPSISAERNDSAVAFDDSTPVAR